MIEYCNRWLAGFAAAYLALLPTNHGTFLKSVAFGGTLYCALALLVLLAYQRERRPCKPLGGVAIPFPGWPLSLAGSAWIVWSLASYVWSVHPLYTAGELRREVVESALVFAAFFIAARDGKTLRLLAGAALVSFTVLAVLALALGATRTGWNAGIWHHGVGPWSTYIVLVAPLLFALIAPAPIGAAQRTRALVVGGLLMALMLATARMTDNRMVWLALAATFGTGALIAALRWPKTFTQSSWRWLAPVAALLIVLGLAFADTVKEKAQTHFPPQTSVEDTIKRDPRLHLWNLTVAKIRERTWLGYGFGRGILGEELRGELRDPTLTHAHNVFVSQWLQTGAIGFGLFVALLGTLLATFVRYVRGQNDTLAFVGLTGLSLLAGFVVKNLTDDLLFRSNAKEFWVLSAMLVGFGARLARQEREVNESASAKRHCARSAVDAGTSCDSATNERREDANAGAGCARAAVLSPRVPVGLQSE